MFTLCVLFTFHLFVACTALPARFTRLLEDNSVNEHDNVVFTCEVSPEKAPVSWYLNDVEIEDGEMYKLEVDGATRRFTIADTLKDEEGTVLVTVGDEKSYGNLTVEGEGKKKQRAACQPSCFLQLYCISLCIIVHYKVHSFCKSLKAWSNPSHLSMYQNKYIHCNGFVSSFLSYNTSNMHIAVDNVVVKAIFKEIFDFSLYFFIVLLSVW